MAEAEVGAGLESLRPALPALPQGEATASLRLPVDGGTALRKESPLHPGELEHLGGRAQALGFDLGLIPQVERGQAEASLEKDFLVGGRLLPVLPERASSIRVGSHRGRSPPILRRVCGFE